MSQQNPFLPLMGLAGGLLSLRGARRGSGNDQEPSQSTSHMTSQALPQLRSLPALPSLPQVAPGPARILPSLSPGSMSTVPSPLPFTPAPPGPSATVRPADVAGSYAEEVENLAIACVPCTRSHLSTMAVAADEGARLASASDECGARVQFARVVGEAAIMDALDWEPPKMQRARPDDRAAIEAITPQVRALIARTPAAPRHVVLAWASVDEALRFARSPRATDADRQEVARRVRLTEDCMNYAERMILSPEGLQRILAGLPESQHEEARLAGPTMREARHRLVSSSYELAALEFIAARLQGAVVALTPPLDPATAAGLAQEYRAIRVAFDRQVLANMAQRARASSDGAL
ncbi:MAG TPA: hypothetical protein VGK74_22165 [Symbiobacteriaceae bacterium]